MSLFVFDESKCDVRRCHVGIKLKMAFLAIVFSVSVGYTGAVLAVTSVNYVVNSTADVTDQVPGNGVCDTGRTPPTGYPYECTLRAAVQEANAHFPNSPSDPDVITLPPGTYTLTISGTMEDNSMYGDLDVRDHLTINGFSSGFTIVDANNIDRGFHVMYGVNAVFNHFTVRNGTAPQPWYPEGHGGGVHNLGTLNLNNMAIENSYAMYEGGGVYNTGNLSVEESRIVYNSGAGGLSNAGAGRMVVNNSVIAANSSGSFFTAGMGGGIRSFGPFLQVTNSLVAGNSATRDGGGMYFGGYARPLIQNVTVSGNRASRYGGGIHARNKADIKSSTITNNYSSNSNGGGGLFVFNSSPSSNAVVTLENTIVSGNSNGWNVPSDCKVPSSVSGSGTNYAQLQSLGYNMDLDNSCNLTATGDQPATNPVLGPLANNGGVTDTHALMTGSPAIDTGSANCPPTDQRGVSRPQDGDGDGVPACDTGAFEAP